MRRKYFSVIDILRNTVSFLEGEWSLKILGVLGADAAFQNLYARDYSPNESTLMLYGSVSTQNVSKR